MLNKLSNNECQIITYPKFISVNNISLANKYSTWGDLWAYIISILLYNGCDLRWNIQKIESGNF